jgi:hypothetical protein
MRPISVFIVLCAALAISGPQAVRAAGPRPKTSVLPFIHDDFPRAVAEARARGVPLFIDVGAPW